MTVPVLALTSPPAKNRPADRPQQAFFYAAVCCGVNPLQCWYCYLRIDLGGLDVRMTENLLNDADVGSVLVHQRCHRVTECRTSERLFRPSMKWNPF